MRDRPPSYETQHNYRTRTGSSAAAPDTHNNNSTGGGVDNPAMEVCEVVTPREDVILRAPPAIYINTPPPPYASTANETPRTSLVRSDPPPYSLVAIKEDSTGPPTTETSNNPADHSSIQGQRDDALGSFKELYI